MVLSTTTTWLATMCTLALLVTASGRQHGARLSGDMPASAPSPSSRGSCWLRVEPTGRCTGLYVQNVTRNECCAMEIGSSSVSQATGWTPYTEMTSRQYFYWVIMGQGAPDCQPCRTSCNNFACGPNKVCRLRHGQPRCVCSADCSAPGQRASNGNSQGNGASFNRIAGSVRGGGNSGTSGLGGPVCAFDGRTYRNQCSLSRYNCRFNKEVHAEYNGRCQRSCDGVSCPAGKNCVHDQNGIPHCIFCITDCPPASSSAERVCGGDGRTYRSLCHLEKEACSTGRSIRLAYQGECRAGLTCSRLRCAESERCLMNDVTMTPACVICDRPCYSASTSADSSAAGAEDGTGLPASSGAVEVLPRRTLCGSDGVTYSSYCEMWRTACDRGVVIDTRHSGPCETAAGEGHMIDDYTADGEGAGDVMVD